jgi:hypothetical protein
MSSCNLEKFAFLIRRFGISVLVLEAFVSYFESAILYASDIYKKSKLQSIFNLAFSLKLAQIELKLILFRSHGFIYSVYK